MLFFYCQLNVVLGPFCLIVSLDSLEIGVDVFHRNFWLLWFIYEVSMRVNMVWVTAFFKNIPTILIKLHCPIGLPFHKTKAMHDPLVCFEGLHWIIQRKIFNSNRKDFRRPTIKSIGFCHISFLTTVFSRVNMFFLTHVFVDD